MYQNNWKMAEEAVSQIRAVDKPEAEYRYLYREKDNWVETGKVKLLNKVKNSDLRLIHPCVLS